MQRWTWCFVVVAALLSGCRQEPTLPPVHLTSANWEQEVLQSQQPVLVDFTATWCGPCQRVAPTVARVAFLYQGRAKVGKLDVDESADIATKYEIKGMPTFMVFKAGVPVAQQVGIDSGRSPRDQLSALIDSAQ